jgi:hypothetical protein
VEKMNAGNINVQYQYRSNPTEAPQRKGECADCNDAIDSGCIECPEFDPEFLDYMEI